MPNKRSLQLVPVADLTPFLGEGELVALNVGPDAQLYAVIALRQLDYRIATSGASFAKIKPDTPQTYRVIAFHDAELTLDLAIAHERFNIHDIQPLPNNELLLVCCRSYYKGPDDFDKNGRVYASNGQLVREILLGDGIQSVQATSDGVIWTSFVDEGVFGNYGWSTPVGASGLVAWDSLGRKLYEFQPADGLDSICDCYALNVESDSSTWLYYYTEFPLVQLQDQRITSHWATPLGGSGAFAVWRDFALFTGGYHRQDDLHLFELGRNGRINQVAELTATDEGGEPINAESYFGRFDTLYALRNNQVFRCDVQAALTASTHG
jgi:hypothetical protein